jgi:hypothetical protein
MLQIKGQHFVLTQAFGHDGFEGIIIKQPGRACRKENPRNSNKKIESSIMLSSSPFSLLNQLIELLPQLLNLLFMEPILQPEEPSKSDHKMIIKYEEEYHQSALVPMSDFNTIATFS